MTGRTVTIIMVAVVAALALLAVLCGVIPLGTTKAGGSLGA